MNNQQAADLLSRYNKWRRGSEDHDQPNPTDLGKAIDLAVAALDKHRDDK